MAERGGGETGGLVTFFVRVPGEPKPSPRPRARAIVRPGQRPIATVYASKEDKDWKAVVRLAASEAFGGGPPASGPVCVRMDFFLTRPPSVSKKKRPYPSVKPDLDNLIKSAKDALKGVVWVDDSQVVRMVASKVYSEDSGPCLELTVEPVV